MIYLGKILVSSDGTTRDGSNSVDAFRNCLYLNNAFYDTVLDVDSIRLNLPKVKQLQYTFRQNNLKSIEISISESLTNLNYTFGGSVGNVLETVTIWGSTKNVTAWDYTFAYGQGLTEIKGTPLDFSSANHLNNLFNNLFYLNEFRVKPNTIKKSMNIVNCNRLSAETLQSIVDGLDANNPATLTCGAHTRDNLLTAEQKATITQKGWKLE